MIEKAWAAFNNDASKIERKRVLSASSLSRPNLLSMSERKGPDKQLITDFRNFAAWDESVSQN